MLKQDAQNPLQCVPHARTTVTATQQIFLGAQIREQQSEKLVTKGYSISEVVESSNDEIRYISRDENEQTLSVCYNTKECVLDPNRLIALQT